MLVQLVSEGVEDSGDVDGEGCADEGDKCDHGAYSGMAAAGEQAEADLDDVNHGKEEEEGANDGSDGGGEHGETEDAGVDVGSESLVDVVAVEEVDGELEPLRDEAGKEEEAEGDDLEDEEVTGDAGAGVARRPVLEAALPRGSDGQPHEDGDGEKRVHVHQPIQGRHVDARRAGVAAAHRTRYASS